MNRTSRACLRCGIFVLLLSGILAAHEKSPAPLVTPSPQAAGVLELRAALSHSGYASSTRLLLKVDYSASAQVTSERPPLNIALVLDSSGSMAEDQKMKYAVDAARSVIENLSARDVISLVMFNDKVTVLSPAGPAVNKAFLYHRLQEVFPEGYTDISAGLLEGLAQIKSHIGGDQLRHILILTDGIANRGVTDAVGMRQIAAKARADGIGVSTLGCGTQFNEKRLRDLAEAGQGRYTYIKTPEQIPTAFEQELQGLLKTAAQNVRLEITVNKGGAITRVNGLALDKPAPSQSFNVGNVRAGEHGLFLVEVKPSSSAAGANIDMTTRLTYDDPQSAQRITREIAVQAPFTSQGEVKEDAEIVLHGQVLEALVAAEEAAKGLDAARYKQAQGGFDTVYNLAHQFALENQDQELLSETFLLKHFMEEFTLAAKQGILHGHREARTKFEKEADYRRYLLQHHRVQGPVTHSGHD